jgi:hypothetical protein
MKVPNIIHFVFGLKEDFGGKAFSLIHYLAIKSAYDLNNPDKIYFHCCYEPNTIWFEKLKPFIHINKVSPPDEVFGNKLYHFAHQADIIRLRTLLEYGGIYLDMDTISVKSLHPLRNYSFAIGKQYTATSSPLRKRIKKSIKKLNASYLNRPIRGLCNAVMLAEPNSFFVNKWYESYQTFRSKGYDEFWDEHSVLMPLQLANEYPDAISMLPAESFHFPLYDNLGLKLLFEEERIYPKAYIHHLWESESWEKYLSRLNIEDINIRNTTYNILARRFL